MSTDVVIHKINMLGFELTITVVVLVLIGINLLNKCDDILEKLGQKVDRNS